MALFILQFILIGTIRDIFLKFIIFRFLINRLIGYKWNHNFLTFLVNAVDIRTDLVI